MTKSTDPEKIPEVKHFMEIEQKIKNLKEEYPGVFEELNELQEEYNTALQAADKAVRATQTSCGPFVLSQTATSYDANAFYDAVGRERFLKLGGSIQTVQQYSIDKTAFEAAAAQGKIAKDTVEVVKKVTPRYKKPDPISIP